MAGIATAIETLRNPPNRYERASSIVHTTPPLHHNTSPQSDQSNQTEPSRRNRKMRRRRAAVNRRTGKEARTEASSSRESTIRGIEASEAKRENEVVESWRNGRES